MKKLVTSVQLFIDIMQLEITGLQSSYVPCDLKTSMETIALIEDNFRQNKDICFYLNKLPVSEYRLNKMLAHYTGLSLYELIQSRIHKEAKVLLKATTMSVKEITYGLGLDDPSNFTKSFIRREGISPSEYRKIKASKNILSF